MFTRGKKFFLVLCLQLMACSFLLYSCHTIDLYERVVPIPKHQWQSSFKPAFSFQVNDTAVPYQLYLIVRHNNSYRYNNIWVKLTAQGPADTARSFTLDLPLATKDGWLGTGMDDVFEHRVAFALDPQKFAFARSGNYTFTLQQVMRDDPLENIMNVGIRIEKKP